MLLSGIAGLITYLDRRRSLRLLREQARGGGGARARGRGRGRAQPARTPPAVVLAGKAAFFMFLYLEVLDASFSFDGVIGAFAITNDIVLMALGLGIGAMYVRSLTVYLVRQGTLDDYVYLEHGAHYAIGALAVILLVTIQYEINEVITGLVGVVLIAWSFWSSVRRNKATGGGRGEERRARTTRLRSRPGCDTGPAVRNALSGAASEDTGPVVGRPAVTCGRVGRRHGRRAGTGRVGVGMVFWDGLWRGRRRSSTSGSAATQLDRADQAASDGLADQAGRGHRQPARQPVLADAHVGHRRQVAAERPACCGTPSSSSSPTWSRRTPRAWSTSTSTWAACTNWPTAPRASCSRWATSSAT